MTTRQGITRPSNTSRTTASTGLTNNGQQSVAAKEADIKRFGEVMRAKRESEKRNSQDSVNAGHDNHTSATTNKGVSPLITAATTSTLHLIWNCSTTEKASGH